jgi:hypothetical protein
MKTHLCARRSPRLAPVTLIRLALLATGLLAGLVLPAPGRVPSVAAQITTQPGPDGTPQFDRAVERRTYLAAGSDEIVTYVMVVLQEAKAVPVNVTPEQLKSSNLRKRLLDLRLMMDFNAYIYDPERLGPMRDQVDEAYEKIGLYKDLYDQSQLTGEPIDPDEQKQRAHDMNNALEWIRSEQQRDALLAVIKRPEHKVLDFTEKEQPRLWRIADVSPTAEKSSLAMAALLAGNALSHLLDDGLLVDDILDPDQEARFHDVRKALRSVLVLIDMFPTAEDVVGDAREPLAKLVDAYGDVNDASIAYHEAEDAHRDTEALRNDLVKEYKKAQKLAQELVDGGQLRTYVTRLTPLQLFDVDPFH